MLVVNNNYVLHGRGIPTSSEERVMVWGYLQKHIVDNNYRLLRQRQLQALGVGAQHCSRLPNAVLSELVKIYSDKL
eukprot:SAG31_NODE_1570_length_7854_cov_2.292328_4_plen_76_part_00